MHQHRPVVSFYMQSSLSRLLLRVAVDHPHHSLYQLLALKNGNRDRNGKVIAGAATSAGAMSHSVDQVRCVALCASALSRYDIVMPFGVQMCMLQGQKCSSRLTIYGLQGGIAKLQLRPAQSVPMESGPVIYRQRGTLLNGSIPCGVVYEGIQQLRQ